MTGSASFVSDVKTSSLAFREHVAAPRVDDLRVEVVLPHVEAVLRLDAFVGDSWADHLREAVDVDGVHVEARLDLAAHLLRPRLGAEDPDLERRAPRVDALTLELVDDCEHVRRRDHDHVGLEVDDQPHLALGHPARDRHDRAAQALGAVVRAESAGEEAVAVCDVHDVPAPAAGGADRPRADVGPRVDVMRRVADDRRQAGRPARGVHADDLLARHREHPERIVLAQVVLRREREPAQVVEPTAVVGMHVGRVEGAPVEGDVLVRVADAPAKPFELE